jgi:hypothetical protein
MDCRTPFSNKSGTVNPLDPARRIQGFGGLTGEGLPPVDGWAAQKFRKGRQASSHSIIALLAENLSSRMMT